MRGVGPYPTCCWRPSACSSSMCASRRGRPLAAAWARAWASVAGSGVGMGVDDAVGRPAVLASRRMVCGAIVLGRTRRGNQRGFQRVRLLKRFSSSQPASWFRFLLCTLALLLPLGKQQHKVLRRLKVGLAQPCSMREKPVKLRRCLIAPFRDQALDGRGHVTRRLCMGKAFQLADFFKQCSVWPDHWPWTTSASASSWAGSPRWMPRRR